MKSEAQRSTYFKLLRKTNGYREISTGKTKPDLKGRFYQIYENLSIDKQEVDAF